MYDLLLEVEPSPVVELNRAAAIAAPFAVSGGSWQRQVPSDLAGQAIGGADRGLAVVPPGVRRQRHLDLRQADAGDVVAIHVRHGHKQGIRALCFESSWVHEAKRAQVGEADRIAVGF